MEEQQPDKFDEQAQQANGKVDPDSTAVREPDYEEVEGSESQVKVRRLSRTRIMAIGAVVLVMVLGLMASQIFSGTEGEETAQQAEEEEVFDEAPVTKLEELEERGSERAKPKAPDKEAELRSKEEQEMKEAEALQAALEKREEEKEEEANKKDDPWEKAKEDASRRHAQQFFQQNLAARGAGVFPRVEAPQSTRSDVESDDEYDAAREKAQFMSDMRRVKASVGAQSRGREVVAARAGAGQGQKQAFHDKRGRTQERSFERLNEAPGQYVVQAGTMLPLVLETGISSDLPGFVKGRFASPVYDSLTGKYLLIPAGTVVIGEYNSKVEYGQTRVQVAWSRMLLPNGKSMQLRGIPAVDLSGQSGVSDQVDNHWDKVVAGAALSSLFSASAAAAAGPTNQFEQRPEQAALGGFGKEVTEAGKDIVEKQLDVQPTLRVRPGFQLAAFVREDLVLEPYVRQQQ